MQAEETLRRELSRARPGFAFRMEESGTSGGEDWEWRWVVDPLDGTTNFLHGIPHWAVSVGIEKRTGADTSELVAGVIYNPAVDEMFWAERGMGAFLNDRRLRVSGRKDLREAVFATGIPFAAVPRKAEFSQILARIMPQVAGVRRFGSAALDLAWTAAGRYDGYWELGIKPWDMAAGLVMVREAGGFATDPGGRRRLAERRRGGRQPGPARPAAGVRVRGHRRRRRSARPYAAAPAGRRLGAAPQRLSGFPASAWNRQLR